MTDQILTEEEIQKLFSYHLRNFESKNLEVLIASHRALNSRNANLVHENDELMAENEKLRNLVSLANNLIPSENITWTNNLKTILEELNHD